MMSHAKRERRIKLGITLSLFAPLVVSAAAAFYLFVFH